MTFRIFNGSMKTTMVGVRILISSLFFHKNAIFYVKVLEFVHIMFKFYVCALFTRLIKKSRTVVKPPHLALLIKKSYGLYPDIIDEMGKQLNFTWENHKEINGDWGLTPISGPFNRSGTFGGIIGEIKNAKNNQN